MLKKIILILAVIMTGVGIFMWIYGTSWISTLNNDILLIDPFNPDSFKDGATGVIRVDPMDIMQIDGEMSLAWIYRDTGTDDEYGNIEIPLIGYKMSGAFSAVPDLTYQDKDGYTRIMVQVVECPEEHRQAAIQSNYEYFKSLYDYVTEHADDNDPEYVEYLEWQISDEGMAELADTISPFECILVDSNNYQLIKVIGITLAVIGALILTITLLTFRFTPKKILAGTGAIILIILAVFLISERKKISTVTSLKEYTDGAYTLRYTADYKLDEILTADISSDDQLLCWVEDNLYSGLPIASAFQSFGCAALSVTTPDGDHLMGRNYDFYETDCVMIYTDPKDGYASIGMVDTQYINVGGDNNTNLTSPVGRMSSLAYPYMTVDGMNEAGVGISILMLEDDEIHQDNGKPDIMMTVAIRAILDTCGSVDEAIALLDSYDMHSMIESDFHLFITDKSGKAVVVEWLDDEMVLTETPAVTNFVMGDPEQTDYLTGGECRRYDALMADLESCGGIASPEEAMNFMSDAADDENDRPGILGTEWSCVYNLEDFEVTVCFDINFDEPYVITPETFGAKR